MKIFGCHGNELPIKEILYQSVFGDKYYMIGHKFTISVTMDVSPFAWCLARAVLNTTKSTYTFTSVKKCHNLIRSHRQTNITARKRHNTNSRAKAKDNQSKEPSNYFLIQISVKPEITLSSALQNKVQAKKKPPQQKEEQ